MVRYTKEDKRVRAGGILSATIANFIVSTIFIPHLHRQMRIGRTKKKRKRHKRKKRYLCSNMPKASNFRWEMRYHICYCQYLLSYKYDENNNDTCFVYNSIGGCNLTIEIFCKYLISNTWVYT
jgi:hypothetical protein